MTRTRAAVLDGAARAVEKYGSRKTTMGDIASLAGIAKATLYNHFRTKPDVYRAALQVAITDLAAEAIAVAASDFAGALSLAADRIGSTAALRRIAADEPEALSALITPGDEGVWVLVRDSVQATLVAAGRDSGPPAVDTVLRWLLSHIARPGSAPAISCGAEALARGLARATTAAGSADTSTSPGQPA